MNTTKSFVMACALLAVAITALPADDVVAEALPVDVAPETELYVEQLHKEASDDIASLMEAGKTKDACSTLADSSKKEITDGQKNTQRLLNRMDVGKNCHTAGLAAYNSAKKRETKARNAYHSANNAANRAKGARIKFKRPVTVSMVKTSGCLDVSKDPDYIKAKRSVANANNDSIRKKGVYDNSRKATANALKGHQKLQLCKERQGVDQGPPHEVRALGKACEQMRRAPCAQGHSSSHALLGGSHEVLLRRWQNALQDDRQG